MTELPRGVIADTLNRKHRRVERGEKSDDRPLLHVSSLIRSDANNFFCPREVVLRYMERRQSEGGGIPPKQSLLWAVGHFYGDYVVHQFIRRNPEWAKYAWGDWACRGGCTTIHRQCYHEVQGRTCEDCGLAIDCYREVDLFNPAGTVIGHADLIFNVDEHYYIYEFKSIDRADVVFAEIADPLGDHLVQASNYYYMLKDEGKRVSRAIRFVYIDRSMEGLWTQQPFREVVGRAIPRRRLANFYRRAKAVHDGIENGVLPQRVCEDISCSRATQCTVAVSCFSRTKNKIRRIPSE